MKRNKAFYMEVHKWLSEHQARIKLNIVTTEQRIAYRPIAVAFESLKQFAAQEGHFKNTTGGYTMATRVETQSTEFPEKVEKKDES